MKQTDPVAQLEEQRSSKSQVAGSSPAGVIRKPKPLNTTQLAALRNRSPSTCGLFCDGSTGNALVARGYAVYSPVTGNFIATVAGCNRAKFKADTIATPTSAAAPDPTLLEDLP